MKLSQDKDVLFELTSPEEITAVNELHDYFDWVYLNN